MTAATDTLMGYKRDEEWIAMTDVTYSVPDMSCDHCKHAVTSELLGVAGVTSVDVDLRTKLVTVRGAQLDDAALRAAIDEAGYDAV
jgi:copper chaperone CopZ